MDEHEFSLQDEGSEESQQAGCRNAGEAEIEVLVGVAEIDRRFEV